MKFKRIILPYELDALEPYISKRTMDLHYNKHHAGYERNVNAALEGVELPENINSLESLMKNFFRLEDKETKVLVRRNGGGLINHDFFFLTLKKDTTLQQDSPFYKALIQHFGDFNEFKTIFIRHAMQVFGSGWAWLCLSKQGKFRIIKTENQDNPWLARGVMVPLLGIDVWEHAYYVDYQNRRAEYVENFFNVINWDKINELFINGMQQVNLTTFQ